MHFFQVRQTQSKVITYKPQKWRFSPTYHVSLSSPWDLNSQVVFFSSCGLSKPTWQQSQNILSNNSKQINTCPLAGPTAGTITPTSNLKLQKLKQWPIMSHVSATNQKPMAAPPFGRVRQETEGASAPKKKRQRYFKRFSRLLSKVGYRFEAVLLSLSFFRATLRIYTYMFFLSS